MPNRTLKINFQKSHDYKTSFVTGIHGGIASNGMLTASFTCDRHALPERAMVEIDERNNVVKSEDIKDSDMIREVPFGVIMDIATAKLIIHWLNGKVLEYESLTR